MHAREQAATARAAARRQRSYVGRFFGILKFQRGVDVLHVGPVTAQDVTKRR